MNLMNLKTVVSDGGSDFISAVPDLFLGGGRLPRTMGNFSQMHLVAFRKPQNIRANKLEQ